MSTPPAINQLLRVIGDLEIVSENGTYQENKAVLSFKASNGFRLGSIRAYGSGPYNNFLIDATECYGGLAIRGSTTEGDMEIGGKGDYMSFTVREGKCGGKFLLLKQYPFEQYGYTAMYGYPNLEVFRASTKDSYSLTNAIADFYQSTWKAGEAMVLSVGFNRNNGCCYFGYTTPSGTNYDSANKGFIAMVPSFGTINKNLVFSQNGDVSSQYKLTVNTLEVASTITCDSLTANGNVGAYNVIVFNNVTTNSIGCTSIEASGPIVADSVSATTYLNLPATDFSPMTLDTTNMFVGINNTTPTEALDVTGNANVSGNINCAGDISGTLTTAAQPNITSLGTLTAVDCTGNISGTLTTAAQPNITSLGTLNTLTVTGDISIDTNTLRVDSTNNRVGINTASPTAALEITGSAIISTDLNVRSRLFFGPTATQCLCQTGSVNPEGGISNFNGGIYSRRNATALHKLYVKQTGDNTNTGWSPLISEATLLPISLDYTNNRVGINKTNPTVPLEVVGEVKADTVTTSSLRVANPITGYTASTTPAAGQIGHRIVSVLASNTLSTASNTLDSLLNVTLTIGTWLVTANVMAVTVSGSEVIDRVSAALQKANNTIAFNAVDGEVVNGNSIPVTITPGSQSTAVALTTTINCTAITTMYLNSLLSYSGSSTNIQYKANWNYIMATRIA